jgi:serine/alanine adding enzyme
MMLPLHEDPQQVWSGLRSEVRNRIRKAIKSELSCSVGGLDLLPDFYRIWTARMRQLGTPCYPRQLIENILLAFPERSRIFLVRMGEHSLGGGLTTFCNGVADMQLVAQSVEFAKFGPNMLLYWSVVEHYCRLGAKLFDFGRCTVGSPTHEFKRRWGAEEFPLFIQYWVRPGTKFEPVLPSSPRYAWKVALWKRFPLWFTRLAGPRISGGLP